MTRKRDETLIFIGFFTFRAVAKTPLSGYNISYFKPVPAGPAKRVPEASKRREIYCDAGSTKGVVLRRASVLRARIVPERSI
jgi:hypothetical protein